MTAKLKGRIISAFKMHGLTLRSEACKYVVDVLTPINEVEREDIIDKIIETIQKQPLTSSLIDRSICEIAVQECNAEQEEGESVLCIIDAFSVPRFTYKTDRKKFIPNETLGITKPCLHGTADDKAALFRDRYTILQQGNKRVACSLCKNCSEGIPCTWTAGKWNLFRVALDMIKKVETYQFLHVGCDFRPCPSAHRNFIPAKECLCTVLHHRKESEAKNNNFDLNITNFNLN